MGRKATTKKSSPFKLENYLHLVSYIANQLGMRGASDFQKFKDVQEGFDSNGRSFMFHNIISQQGVKIPEDKLAQYDDNIRSYVRNLSKYRSAPISLRYFQYLAALFSEIYLDRYFQNPIAFLNELNEYLSSGAAALSLAYSRRDLRKIAFWMATGSGKTLLMHINYWQLLVYNKGPHKIDFDNIILITPTEDLTRQHIRELEESGVKATQFQGETGGYFVNQEEEKHRIKVIDIYKLKLPEDKKGEGVTIDISSFGARNIVFVDEGHKGHASEDRKWKRTREELAKDGFTFEYSATFGQAINNSKDADFAEYSKAILFDYSYKYFFKDGFGKDFRILNLDPGKFTEQLTDTLLLANTVSFYEQREVYNNLKHEVVEYNVEPPLWIFVGHKVQEDTSDVLRVIQFLGHLIQNKDDWVLAAIEKIIKGKSGLVDKDGNDVFAQRHTESSFAWLRAKKYAPAQILEGVLTTIFHLPPGSKSGKLHLLDIKNADGEIGLRVSGSDKMFGVINIGNKSEFIKLLEERKEDVILEKDTIGSSLFDQINQKDSPINILIGAKKFIEGWNSWRVSNMGLLNVGKQEGSQIIQLFGRGVRLKGRGFSLKRSGYGGTSPVPFLDVLETLNIFGIKAAYMDIFKECIEKEEVAYKTITLETKLIEPFPENLHILRVTKPVDAFKREKIFELDPVSETVVSINLLPRVNIEESRTAAAIRDQVDWSTPRTIDEKIISILDWNEIHSELLRFKVEKGWSNILITKESLKKMMVDKKYELLCHPDLIKTTKFEDINRIQEVAILILKKHIERNYSKNINTWAKENIEVVKLRKEDSVLSRSYTIKVRESDETAINAICGFKDSGEIYKTGCSPYLLNTRLDAHLYQPLFALTGDVIFTVPAGLNTGEREFIENLREFIKTNPEQFKGKTIYVLRNLTKGRGVGFFETHRFFPDFILWLSEGNRQKITFIDPKGLVHVERNDPKLKLYQYLKDEVEPKIKCTNPNICLDAFIISDTPFDTYRTKHILHGDQTLFEKEHILFQYKREGIPDTDYVKKMFGLLGGV